MSPRLSAFVVVLSASVAGAVPVKLPGFPIRGEGVIRGACTVADVDKDGSSELIVETGGKVAVYAADGKPKGAGPIDFAAFTKQAVAIVVGSPAVGDVDGDGRAEIALAFSYGDLADGSVVVLHADGTPLWATPFPVPKGPGAGPTIVDVNGDGKADVVFGGREGKLFALDAKAQPLPKFPVKLEGTPTSPVSFGSLVRGGKPALAVGTQEGRVFVVHPDGAFAKGFPIDTRFVVTGAPAFGDIDNDGEHELVIASQDFSVYAANADGSMVGGLLPSPAFPVSTGYRIYGGPALADLDRDGSLEVIVGAGDGKLYAWNARGKLLPGWPVTTGGKLTGSVVVADADRDGFDDVFVAVGDGIFGFDAKGRTLDGFPIRVSGELLSPPVLSNLVADPNVELVIGGSDGTVYGWRIGRVSDMPMSSLSWPAPSHDSARQGHFGPNPPRYRNVVIAPDKVRAGQAIKLSYEFSDLDGDAEPQTLIRWTIDGQHQADLDGKREVPGDRVHKGQEWKASLQSPDDYALYKEGPAAQISWSNAIKVADTAPGAAKVSISPEKPKVTDPITATVSQPATDADGDALQYKFRWLRDGEPDLTGPVVKAGVTRKGERWKVQVVANDGELDGPLAEAEVVIANSVPDAPSVVFAPASGNAQQDLSVSLARPASDADGDTLSYRHVFSVNGQKRALPGSRPLFGKGGARRGDTVSVEVWAFDGEAEGPRARAEAKVVDAPPTAPKIALAPAQPRRDDALTVGVTESARDPDGDPVSYKVQWWKDGQPYGAPGQLSVPAREAQKGQTWNVSVVATDGELDSPEVRAQVRIANTAPSRPRIGLTAGDDQVVRVVEPSVDPDGDAVTYEYQWTIDGKPAGLPKDRAELKAGEAKKGQRWAVEVTPVDGEGARGASAVLELRLRNTAPGKVGIALDPPAPTRDSGLKVVVSSPAVDRDGDAVTYRTRWFRNGAPVPELNDRLQLKAGEVARGEVWRVAVLAFDGELEGPASELDALVGNLPPGAAKVAIKPEKPVTGSPITCDLLERPADVDGDGVTIQYHWQRDGKPFPAGADQATIPGALLNAGQVWKCEAWGVDAHGLAGKAASAQTTIEGSAPGAPQVVIDPPAPKPGEPLACAIAAEAADPDGDRVSYQFRWLAPAGVTLPKLEDPSVVPGAVVKKGQVWRCEVAATDGKAASPFATSPEAKVGNTPPKAPRLKIVPSDAPAGAELRCDFAAPAVDVDGDTLSYAFTWFRNGEKQAFAETSAAVPARMVKAGDRWRCAAVVSDAEGPGGSARSLEVVISAAAGGSK